MPTSAEHAELVLAAVLPSRADLLTAVQKNLTEEHFPEDSQKFLYRALMAYADSTGGVLTMSAFKDLLMREPDVGRRQLLAEHYRTVYQTQVPDDQFRWSILELRSRLAEESTKEAITVGMEALTRGIDVNGELVKGHEAARELVKAAFADIEKEFLTLETPEGNVRDEGADFLKEYSQQKDQTRQHGINFGIPTLDSVLGGLQPGELIMSVGWSSDGKTSLCVQLAWSAAVEQGKNVVFLTTETSRATVYRKLIARHSAMEKFSTEPFEFPVPRGLNSRALKGGSLSEHEEYALHRILDDFGTNPDYGRLYVAQVARSATLADVEAQLYRIQRDFNIDLVVFDYLALLRSERRRGTEREELAAIIKEAKQLSTTFDSGRGIPFVSPWQVTRAARDLAERVGAYSMQSLAETSEATNSADVIISILAPTDNTDRIAEIKGQVLKNRDGERSSSLLFDVDYATSSFRSKSQFANLSFDTGVSGGLDTLLNY